MFSVLAFYCKRVYLVPKQVRILFVYLIGYISVLVAFMVFVIVNGSIVVGDKAAHEAAVHFPQVWNLWRLHIYQENIPNQWLYLLSKIFYFSLFFTLFAPSIAFTYIGPAIGTLRRRWILAILAIILSMVIIHKNTIVHPYMLADNRHYVFYVWNKFYGRYSWCRFAMAPFYLVSTIILYHSISVRSAGFQLVYALCTIVSIALQQLIEFRYFIIPFLIARLSIASVKFKLIIFELVMYLTINAIIFYLFSTKEIYWNDYDYVQRLIW